MQTGNRGVLDLDTLVRQSASEAGDLAYGPHHPTEQIDIVDGLVHERPAAVQGLGAFPAAFVIIGLRPPPFAGCFAQSQPTESPTVDRFLERLIGVPEA